MYKIKLILVDDHLLFTEGLCAVLEKEEDIEILATFSDASMALQELTINVPDLLITDISMPNMNGIEFINKVKEKRPKLKILVASMFHQMIPHKKINGYLLKDTNSKVFLEAIREIVNNENNYFIYRKKNETEKFYKSSLTARETEIVKLIAKEKTVYEIADSLFLSKHTIEAHKKNIFLKLKVKTNAGLIKKAIILGIII